MSDREDVTYSDLACGFNREVCSGWNVFDGDHEIQTFTGKELALQMDGPPIAPAPSKIKDSTFNGPRRLFVLNQPFHPLPTLKDPFW